MARVRVVLNRPETPENVGAAARVVANTDLAGLDLVEPCDYRTVECWRMAWRSEDVLEGARVFGSLQEALEGAAYVACFAGRQAKRAQPITPRQMAAEIARLPAGSEAAVVFGCESKGLPEEELRLCQRRVRIPTSPRQPSLNLAQAVMVAGYEIFLASEGDRADEPLPRAPHEESDRALQMFREALLQIEFLPRDNPEARFVEWRELFGRAALTPRETKILLALSRRIQNVGRIARTAKGG